MLSLNHVCKPFPIILTVYGDGLCCIEVLYIIHYVSYSSISVVLNRVGLLGMCRSF